MPSRYRLPLALILLNLIVFFGVWNHPFSHFDDDIYVYSNPFVIQGLTPAAVKAAFFSTEIGHWHPVAWLSHLLDSELFGMNPAGHHVTSLVFHMVNTLLLFVLLRSATGETLKSGLVAALFAVHPLHVEPVVWISSRKDVLSTALWILAALAYLWYTRRPSVARYVTVAVLTGLGLAAKSMVLTLPLTFLILDFWPLNRVSVPGSLHDREKLKRAALLVLEKLPLMLLCAASFFLGMRALQAGDVLTTLDAFPLSARLLYAPLNYSVYLLKTVWPSGLIPIYPHPGPSVPWVAGSASALFLVFVTWLVVKSKERPLIMGWAWYLVTLLPVIGLVHFAAHIRADRYTYVPLIGVFVMLSWGGAKILRALGPRTGRWLAPGCSITLVIVLAVTARGQVSHWGSDRSLTRHMINVFPNHASAENNLGLLLIEEGKPLEAVPHFEKALKIHPGNLEAVVNLGSALRSVGQTDRAMMVYAQALRQYPKSAALRMNLANCLVGTGKYQAAYEHYMAAAAIDPNSTVLNFNMARYFEIGGQWDRALDHYDKLLKLAPGFSSDIQRAIARVEAAKARGQVRK